MARRAGRGRVTGAAQRGRRGSTPGGRAAAASGAGARSRLHDLLPRVSEAYEQLALATRASGPIDAHGVALVKVALSVGQGSLRGTHAHARKALEAGVTPSELRHLVAVALPSLGLAATLDALRWVEETIDEQEPEAGE